METRENRVSVSFSRGIFLTRFGSPLEVVEERAVMVPQPCVGEVLIGVELAPINPADLNVLEGKYGTLPALPCVPGIEGVGRVLEVGAGLGVAGEELEGKRVLLPHGFGSWRSHGTALASELVVVPEAVPVEQASMLRINPATALVLLEHFVELKPGEWIVQNAANSGVGRSVIQIARACGWRTINVVRRAGLGEELRAIGADAVLESSEDLGARIAGITGGVPPRLGLNAVGGESALALAKTLAESGVLVTYGAMGLQPVRIPNGLLIFKDLAMRGLWISRWYKNATLSQRYNLFERLFHWASTGVLHTPVEAIYSLENSREAIAHAMRDGRGGKVLFKG
ncbi:MAG: NADPH:quinone reductase [Verrucomicrobia bacterium]|nr:MAG: NADPH:quinone reductase [Verrucomicrobiota bacterium]